LTQLIHLDQVVSIKYDQSWRVDPQLFYQRNELNHSYHSMLPLYDCLIIIAVYL